MRKYFYRFQAPLYKLIKWYYRKPRIIKKRGLKFKLNPTVFHPSLYHSTDVLLDFVLRKDPQRKSILELGCGNAFISLFLAKNSTNHLFASDINEKAIEGVKSNCLSLDAEITIWHSNLFDSIPSQSFDIILVNPPYFKGEVNETEGYAFYTGKNHEYFEKLFSQVRDFMHAETQLYLIFSNTTELEPIFEIAKKNLLDFKLEESIPNSGEVFSIYSML